MRYFSWITLLTVVASNFVFILNGTVNVPFMDEWELVTHLDKLDLSWLFAFHNEHRIVFTKLLFFLIAKINGLNIYTCVAINYILFIILTIVLYKILKPITKNYALLPLFFIPLFSLLNINNLTVAFQSQFHFMILFGLIAIIFGFLKENKAINNILFALFLDCSMFSMNFAYATGIMLIYLFKEFVLEKSINNFKELFSRIFLPLIVFLPALIGFFIGYVKPAAHPKIIYPWQPLFWKFFSNLFVKGISGRTYPLIIEIIITLLIIAYVLNFFKRPEFAKNKNIVAVLTVFFASMCSLVTVTIGRAGFGIIASSRHVEIVIILIPVLAAILYLDKNYKAKNLLFIYSAILIIGFNNKISYFKYPHGGEKIEKSFGVDCIEYFYKYPIDHIKCTFLYPNDIADRLKIAKQRNLSFTRDVERK